MPPCTESGTEPDLLPKGAHRDVRAVGGFHKLRCCNRFMTGCSPAQYLFSPLVHNTILRKKIAILRSHSFATHMRTQQGIRLTTAITLVRIMAMARMWSRYRLAPVVRSIDYTVITTQPPTLDA